MCSYCWLVFFCFSVSLPLLFLWLSLLHLCVTHTNIPNVYKSGRYVPTTWQNEHLFIPHIGKFPFCTSWVEPCSLQQQWYLEYTASFENELFNCFFYLTLYAAMLSHSTAKDACQLVHRQAALDMTIFETWNVLLSVFLSNCLRWNNNHCMLPLKCLNFMI